MSHRLLYIIGSHDRPGAQRQLALLAAHLPRAEFDVHVCLLETQHTQAAWLDHDPQRVHRIERRWQWDLRTYRALVQLIQRLQPAVVQSWLFEANAYARMAASVARVPALVAVERHWDTEKHWTQWRVDRQLARRTACLVANSPAVLGFYRSHRVEPRSTEIIPDGVEPPLPPTQSRAELMASLRVAGDVRLIVAAGSLLRENRFKDLIWATDILKIIHGDVHLVILGDGPHRRRLERYQKNARIEDRVHFLGWRDDARQLLALADLFWLAGNRQGAPAALLESLAAGVPAVVTDTASHRAIVTAGQTGFLVPVGDRAALAKYANRLLEDRALAGSMGAAARHDVLARFAAPAMADRYAALYRRLLA